jgi:NAD(P)-dependent dehydrogenase (short-subunit alcohol dehydrogenase family)
MAESMHRAPELALETEDIAGKAIVITGGTTGIGRATALLLASKGAKVLVFGRHEPELNDAMNDLHEISQDVYGLTADTSSIDDIRRLFEEADRRMGGVDVLINNAALSAGAALDKDYTDWEYVVRTNLLGYIGCVQEAAGRMRERGGGHIVNIGSMSADLREEGNSVYVATKAGVDGFTESLRKEVNRFGIKVSLIEPGKVATDMPDQTPGEQRKDIAQEKMLRAEDIAACVYYCLSQPKRCDVVLVQIRPHGQEI